MDLRAYGQPEPAGSQPCPVRSVKPLSAGGTGKEGLSVRSRRPRLIERVEAGEERAASGRPCRTPGRVIIRRFPMRENIRLVSSAGTGFTYYTTKNKRTQTNKLELKKYDPVKREHVIFKEAKMPPHSK